VAAMAVGGRYTYLMGFFKTPEQKVAAAVIETARLAANAVSIAKADQASADFHAAQQLPVIRHYKDEKSYLKDANEMLANGYSQQNQNGKDGKFNVGRTVAKGLIFLPWAILRPSRQGEQITVMWIRN
jgi:hypothetical protein